MNSYNRVIAVLLLGYLGIGLWMVEGHTDFGNQAANILCDNPPVAERQIMKLPEDGNAYYTTIFVDRGDNQIVSWFQTNEQLKSLKAQTHFKVFVAGDPMAARYRKTVTAYPAVVVQKPDGTRVYQTQGNEVPTSAWGLASDIQGNLYERCPWRRPKPAPATPATPTDEPPDLDNQGPPGTAGATGWEPNLILAIISLIVGLGLGVGTSYYEQYYGDTQLA